MPMLYYLKITVTQSKLEKDYENEGLPSSKSISSRGTHDNIVNEVGLGTINQSFRDTTIVDNNLFELSIWWWPKGVHLPCGEQPAYKLMS